MFAIIITVDGTANVVGNTFKTAAGARAYMKRHNLEGVAQLYNTKRKAML
jgi:hypothetical protein